MLTQHKYYCEQLGRPIHNKETTPVSKRVRQTKRNTPTQNETKVIDFARFKNRKQNVNILPKNLIQEDYLALIDDDCMDVIFAIGPAGTGKTMIAVLSAIKALKAGDCEKIVITRPAVSADEDHGFLPGTLVEKMAPWTRPIFDIFEEYYTPAEIVAMIAEGVIEVSPLAYMRGRTFKHSIIIADEVQLATPNQVKMLLTRLGVGSRMFLTGDLAQTEKGREENGLKDFVGRIPEDHHSIAAVKFTRAEVERHPTVKAILAMYGDED
jgi:phosphate starvation-inducible PhoH-like protein